MKPLLILATLLLLISCKAKTKTEFTPDKKAVQFEGQILEWYYDQNGELTFNEPMRDFFMIWKGRGGFLDGKSRRDYHEILSGGGFFIGMKKKDVVEYMGKDERKSEYRKNDIIQYYTEGNCWLNPESDCCWCEF